MARKLYADSGKLGVWEDEKFDTGELVLPNGNLVTHNAVHFLQAFGIDPAACATGLTAPQIEVAKLEAELEEAVTEGRITNWRFECNPVNYKTSCMYTIEGDFNSSPHSFGPTRLLAARAAVEYVRSQEPKLPALDGMAIQDLKSELRQRGWTCKWDDAYLVPEVQKPDRCAIRAALSGEDITDFLRRALGILREQDSAQ